MLKKIAFLLLFIAPMSVFAQKFAHFRSVDIIQVMPEFAKAQTDIQTMQYEDEIKRAEEEFQKKFADFQQEQKTLPQNILERRQKDLQEMQQKGIQFQQDAQQQLDQAYRGMMEPIYKKLEDAVKAIGQSKDVTNDIKTKLGISLTAAPYNPATAAPAAAPAN